MGANAKRVREWFLLRLTLALVSTEQILDQIPKISIFLNFKFE